MSVLIKMDMPENCGCCDLNIWDSNNGDYRCFFTGKYTSASTSDGKRNTDCPLVEVPPHGDLIELNSVMETVTEWCPDDDGSVGKIGDLREVLNEIESLPIIIEAEGGRQ